MQGFNSNTVNLKGLHYHGLHIHFIPVAVSHSVYSYQAILLVVAHHDWCGLQSGLVHYLDAIPAGFWLKIRGRLVESVEKVATRYVDRIHSTAYD